MCKILCPKHCLKQKGKILSTLAQNAVACDYLDIIDALYPVSDIEGILPWGRNQQGMKAKGVLHLERLWRAAQEKVFLEDNIVGSTTQKPQRISVKKM